MQSALMYTIDRRVTLLRDTPYEHKTFYDLEFHLKNGDYFGVLAGMLGFIIDDYAQKTDTKSVYYASLLRTIQRDLASLHRTHDIIPKPKLSSPSPKKG